VGYDFRSRILRRFGGRMDTGTDLPVVPGVEGFARPGIGQDRFRSHQPIKPSQSTSATGAKDAYTMMPGGIRGSPMASISVPTAAATSISLAAWMSVVRNLFQLGSARKSTAFILRGISGCLTSVILGVVRSRTSPVYLPAICPHGPITLS
jgi:hypothetical protein